MALIDMTLSKEEANEEAGVTPDLPKYPYGLCLWLDDDTLKKLGITQLPAVGTTMTLTASVKVTATRASETMNEDKADTDHSIDMQITAMEISASASSNAADKLYGG